MTRIRNLSVTTYNLDLAWLYSFLYFWVLKWSKDHYIDFSNVKVYKFLYVNKGNFRVRQILTKQTITPSLFHISPFLVNGKRAACNYRVMDARGRLLSTKEA